MNLVNGALALGARGHGHGLLTDGVQTSAGIPWKVAVAAYLKETTDVSNTWLAGQLDMGSPVYASKHVGQLRKAGLSAAGKWLQHLREVNGKA